MTTVLEDANGYKANVTLSCTDWIKGSDTASVQASWHGVGGSGAVPIQNGNWYQNFYVTDTSLGAFLFCTVRMTNGSPGYPFSQWGAPSAGFRIGSYPNYPSGSPQAAQCQADMAGAQSYDGTASLSYVNYSSPKMDVNPNVAFGIQPSITGDQWGPVGAMIYVDGVFSPKNPNGDPCVTSIILDFNGDDATTMAIGRSWG